jgi:hypothetical protein
MLAPVRFPGFQTKVAALEAVNVEQFPAHTAAGEAATETTGFGTTMIVMVFVPGQPAAEVPITV